jgi:hypothetical protein
VKLVLTAAAAAAALTDVVNLDTALLQEMNDADC